MFGKQTVPMFITACLFGASGAMPACAADLTLQYSPRAYAGTTSKAPPAKRHEKPRQRGITTYRLNDDPIVKQHGLFAEKRQFATVSSGFANISLPAVATNSIFNAGPAAVDDGTAFNCWTQVTSLDPRTRGMTACYRQQADKGWKAQPYISRGSIGSKLDLGGGLALSYAD